MAAQSIPDVGLQKAVDAVGSQSALARLLGRAQQTISDRLRSGNAVWAEDVLKIEAATGLSRHDLRPDLYPREEPDERTPPPAPVESLDRRPADPFVEARR